MFAILTYKSESQSNGIFEVIIKNFKKDSLFRSYEGNLIALIDYQQPAHKYVHVRKSLPFYSTTPEHIVHCLAFNNIEELKNFADSASTKRSDVILNLLENHKNLFEEESKKEEKS